ALMRVDQPDRGFDFALIQRLALAQPPMQRDQRILGDRRLVGGTADIELVAARDDRHAAKLLDAGQVAGMLAVKQRQVGIVVELDLDRFAGPVDRRGGQAGAPSGEAGATAAAAREETWESDDGHAILEAMELSPCGGETLSNGPTKLSARRPA